MKTKLAVIGASYLQDPLIQKAKSMGIETHVFAWKADDVGEKSADFFYPISITEKDEILKKCREIGIDGICSIASDLAVITVNYVANHMGLPGNSEESTRLSTNKHFMREAFLINGDPSPESIQIDKAEDIKGYSCEYPLIVKPVDRSGSRAITKLYDENGLHAAINEAIEQSFAKKALVEEFAEGDEYSVECISYRGVHHFLAFTQKYTTGAPHFIETAHLEPAALSRDNAERIRKIVFHALTSLKIENGASHAELKIAPNGTIRIIEIGARMGGDFIGSDLVEMSTGIDFVKAVIQISLGMEPDLAKRKVPSAAAVRFIFDKRDEEVFNMIRNEAPEILVRYSIPDEIDRRVTDSSSRLGYYLIKADYAEKLMKFLPDER